MLSGSDRPEEAKELSATLFLFYFFKLSEQMEEIMFFVIKIVIALIVAVLFTKWVFKIDGFYKNQERIMNILQDILQKQTGKKIPPSISDDISDLNDEQKSFFASLLSELNAEYNNGEMSDESYAFNRIRASQLSRKHK